VTLDGVCSLPLGGAATGQITVSGSWSSATSATVQAQFVNVRVAATKDVVALSSVTSIMAEIVGQTVTVKYVGANAQARSGASNTAVGGSSDWDVSVDTKGTADAADDVLVIDATSASAAAGLGASAKVTTFNGVTIDPSCTENPIAGSGSITAVSTFIPSITNIEFHSACDGKAEANHKSYPFDF
jgi:hypothetical protein